MASRLAVPISPVARCIPYFLKLMPHLTKSEAKCTPHLTTFIIIVRGAAMTAPSVKTQCKQLEVAAVEKRTVVVVLGLWCSSQNLLPKMEFKPSCRRSLS